MNSGTKREYRTGRERTEAREILKQKKKEKMITVTGKAGYKKGKVFFFGQRIYGAGEHCRKIAAKHRQNFVEENVRD